MVRMIGSSVGKGRAGFVPWTDFAWGNWSLLAGSAMRRGISSVWGLVFTASSRFWAR